MMSENSTMEANVRQAFYESARGELIQRIQARDNVALLFLGATSTLFGVAFAQTSVLEILLVVPFLSMAAVMITSQHHVIVGGLAKYCATEIRIDIPGNNGKPAIPQWDNSDSLNKLFRFAMSRRWIAHLFIFVVPAVASLVLNYGYAMRIDSPLTVVFYFGCFLVLLTIWQIQDATNKRTSMFHEQCDTYRKTHGKPEDLASAFPLESEEKSNETCYTAEGDA